MKLRIDGDRELEMHPDRGEWELTLPPRGASTRTNDAGLLHLLALYSQPQDPHAKVRCVLDYPWQCPYAQAGGHWPCISRKRRDAQHLATVEFTNWEKHRVPVGQMSLFAPRRSHRYVWRHVQSGRILDQNERPYNRAALVCRDFAVATMEYHKRKLGWTALKWRILPANDDIQWLNDMQIKHSGRYDACVFDSFD